MGVRVPPFAPMTCGHLAAERPTKLISLEAVSLSGEIIEPVHISVADGLKKVAVSKHRDLLDLL